MSTMVWAGTSVVGSSAAMEVAPTKDGSAIVRLLKHSKMREYQGKGIYTLYRRLFASPSARTDPLQLPGVGGVSLAARGCARAGEDERELDRSIRWRIVERLILILQPENRKIIENTEY